MSSWVRFGVDEALSKVLDDSQEYDSSGDECLDGADDLDETDLQLPAAMVRDDLNDDRCDRDLKYIRNLPEIRLKSLANH